MFSGNRTLLACMHADAARRGQTLVHATAEPGASGGPGWFASESCDERGGTCAASGVTYMAWHDEFLGVTACPAHPFAPGDGVTIMFRRHPEVCTVTAVRDNGATLEIQSDRAILVSGDRDNGVYRFEADPEEKEWTARWNEERRAWAVYLPGFGPVPLAHGRGKYHEDRGW